MIDDFIAAARACLNTPFQHQGRTPGIALDCAGLVVCAAKAVGIVVQDRSNYGRLPFAGELEAALDGQSCLQRVIKAEAGDIILMRFGRDPQHLGIFTGDTVIHAYQPFGKVCEHRIDATWQRRIIRAYRLVDLHV